MWHMTRQTVLETKATRLTAATPTGPVFPVHFAIFPVALRAARNLA